MLHLAMTDSTKPSTSSRTKQQLAFSVQPHLCTDLGLVHAHANEHDLLPPAVHDTISSSQHVKGKRLRWPDERESQCVQTALPCQHNCQTDNQPSFTSSHVSGRCSGFCVMLPEMQASWQAGIEHPRHKDTLHGSEKAHSAHLSPYELWSDQSQSARMTLRCSAPSGQSSSATAHHQSPCMQGGKHACKDASLRARQLA